MNSSSAEKTKKSTQANYALFGLIQRIQKPNGDWFFKIVWSRVLLFFVSIFLLLWVALSVFIYCFFKYGRDYEEMTIGQAFIMPFDRTAHRERIGMYNIRKAKEYIATKQWRDAYANLVVAVSRLPKNEEARQILAEFYIVMFNRPDIAIEYLEGALVYAKNNPAYVRLYMRLLLEQSEDSKVISVGEKLLDDAETTNKDVIAYLAMSVSSVYAFHGNYEKSKYFLKKFKLDKTIPGILRLSKNEWEQGKRDEAIQILADNFQYVENREPIYALLVNYYTAMGDFDKARQYSMLRNVENPFALSQRLEYLRLLKKTGDEKGLARDLENLIKQYQNENRSLLLLANFAADTGDMKFMRRIYDIALKKNFPPAPYCLLLLETTLTDGDYKSATDFSEEILKGKPVWAKKYEDVISCLRAIAYYATGNVNMADILLSDVLKRGTASAKVLIATARRLDQLGATMLAHKMLESVSDRFPRHQLALTRLVQMEIALGNSTNLDKHIYKLLQMRRPPRELVEDAKKKILSDRFIFTADRDKIIKEIEMLMPNTPNGMFNTDVSEDKERITSGAEQVLDF